jgi:hypothetical protein
MIKQRAVLAGLLLICGPAHAAQTEFLWFSEGPSYQRPAKVETPAAHEHQKAASGKHDHGTTVENAVADTGERSQNHASAKHLWLRVGDDPLRSAMAGPELISSSVRVLAADGRSWSEIPEVDNGRYHVAVPLEEMGFYNVYLTQGSVRDGVLHALVAKAELLKGTCCKKGVDPLQEKAISDDSQPIELVRDHMPDEKLFTRLMSGDKINFTVKSLGQPLSGAAVTLKTQQGWQKTLFSDKDGRVEFTMIRDYFPSWDKFYRLNKQTFLIVAEVKNDKPGIWRGEPYHSAVFTTTLAGKYSPSPYDYRSYAFGLGISLGVIVFLGTGIYLYRRRRTKPFQEIRFHEAA